MDYRGLILELDSTVLKRLGTGNVGIAETAEAMGDFGLRGFYTTEIVGSATYNAGDVLIGSSVDGESRLWWDASAATLNLQNGALAFGNPPPTSATTGTGIWIDDTGIYGLASNTQQAYMRASDGKILAGAGNVVLDVSGVSLAQGNGTTNSIKWLSGSTTYGRIYETVGAAAGLYITNDDGNNASEGQINISSDKSSGDGKGGLNLAAASISWAKSGAVGAGQNLTLGGLAAVKKSSTTIANTTTETSLGTTVSLVGNTAVAGDIIRIKAWGYFSTTGTPDMRFVAYVGSTSVATTTNIAGPSGVSTRGFMVEVNITVRSIGASGSTFTQGMATVSTTGSTASVLDMETTATDTIDTTTNQTIDLKFAWGTASASNTLTCTNLVIEILGGQ